MAALEKVPGQKSLLAHLVAAGRKMIGLAVEWNLLNLFKYYI